MFWIIHVFKIDERIVDGLDYDILVAQGIPEDLYRKVSTNLGDKGNLFVEAWEGQDNTTDTAKSVDSDVDGHGNGLSEMN